MRLLKSYTWWLLIVLALLAIWWLISQQNISTTTSTVAEIGTVSTFVSVSGVATVDDIIPLSFPKNGTVSGVFVSRGDEVATGTVLATIGDSALQAEYSAASSELSRAKASRDEIINGQTTEEAAVTAAIITNAEIALYNTIRTEQARVETARTTLFNTGLSAVATDPEITPPPPQVSGSYACTAEGTYTIQIYRSRTLSGYSYNYSGIESGVGNASTNQSSPLGNCGLRLQFTPGANYNDATFTITIPNTKSQTYGTNRALYEQALVQEEANIKSARQALDLALNQGSVATAGARVERLIAANAVVSAAEARLAQVSYALSENALRAPSSGVITNVSVVSGQAVTATPIITLFSPRQTLVTARVPEKDVAKITMGQTAHLVFDANPDETIYGEITFLSPIQTIVSGIPYYDAVIKLQATPAWLRSGMQADVKIITESLDDVVRIPRLFMVDGQVLIKTGETINIIRPEVLLVGSDGFVAVSGLEAGNEIILPTK
jgi:multidrug resistance efflux pump